MSYAPSPRSPGARPAPVPGDLVHCPECGLPAEVVDRFALRGSPRPVEHARVACLAGHRYTPTIDRLQTLDAVATTAAHSAAAAIAAGATALRTA
jgi:hypothetical protein